MSDSRFKKNELLEVVNGHPWIQSIHVNKIRHLEDFDICICDNTAPRHLMVTGPNGSGKTSLLLAMKGLLEKMAADKGGLGFELPSLFEKTQYDLKLAKQRGDQQKIREANLVFDEVQNRYLTWFRELTLSLHEDRSLFERVQKKNFIIAYYPDNREANFHAVQTPAKPKFKHGMSQNNGDQFIQFLVNLKIQQALAKNEGKNCDADDIEAWFESFVDVLRRLFKDDALRLEFNYRDYSFEIVMGDVKFPFTGLSAGYAAAMDIVADLMLRMQTLNRLTRVFDMHGIALIDEVETHLHLALQQDIMPFLTTVFPKVQFIVSTHSPFVLNSIPDATIYDLKNKQCVQNLTEYSYEALAEGYFGVETDSGELKMRLDNLEELLSKQSWTDSDKLLIRDLIDDFEKIPDGIAPAQKTRFYEMKRQYLLAGGKL